MEWAGAPRQSLELIKLHQVPVDAVDVALQEWLEKRATGIRVVLDLQNATVYYRSQGSRHRLGPLERKRRQGNIHPEIPPEKISDDSPLIRDEMYEALRFIGGKQLYKLIHGLYFKAGLLKQNNGGRYALCVHSLRKFFKTQLMALGVQGDYVDYMMGHTVDTYHDIQSKGIEFLRGLYANSGFRIRPKGSLNPKEQLRAIARGFGLNPEEAARLLTSSEPHRAYASQEDREEHEIQVLCDAITERIRERILAGR